MSGLQSVFASFREVEQTATKGRISMKVTSQMTVKNPIRSIRDPTSTCESMPDSLIFLNAHRTEDVEKPLLIGVVAKGSYMP